jgi:aspartyl-tRNA(Asn)/glutamyl-tRNA(Gln) amidotransferase subunit B
VEVSDEWLAQIKSEIGELPAVRRKRYSEALGLGAAEVEMLIADRQTGDFLEGLTRAGLAGKRAYSIIEAMRSVGDYGLSADRAAEVGKLADAGKLAANKETLSAVLRRMLGTQVTAEQAASDLGLIQSSDTGVVDAAIDALIAQNPKPLQDYKAGKQAALGALVGMVMKGGKGLSAKVVQERLKERLSS